MWGRLTHPNVLPLLGVTIDGFQLISNWMSGGHLLSYLQGNTGADRLGLVGIPPSWLSHAYSLYQLSDVAKGLCYLHSRNVVHGDLKGVCGFFRSRFTTTLTHVQLNVLVDDTGHACLADFGFATVTQNLDSIRSTQPHHGHTGRWAALEILNEGRHSKEADVFAFAMVMVEVRHPRSTARRALAYYRFVSTQVFTGAIPFSGYTDARAISAILQGNSPPRPTHPTLTEKLWTLMQNCWHKNPHSRPEISEALQVLTPSVPRSSRQSYIR